METRDLSSYIAGYDAYCEELEEQAKVPFGDYKKIEEERDNLINLLNDIKSTLNEKTTMIEKYKILNALIEDFEV